MNIAAVDNWQITNRNFLMASVAKVRQMLVQHADLSLLESHNISFEEDSIAEIFPKNSLLPSQQSTLERLCTIFALSEFEQNLLLLCAGMELDASFAVLCAAACGDAQRSYPTFGLAIAALEGMHWSALAPTGPLRKWRLIEVGTGWE